MHQSLLDLQARYFSAEQQALFAEENRLRELAIEKRRIYEQYGQSEEAQRAWQALLLDQPDFIQRSEATAQLLPQLTQAGQGIRSNAIWLALPWWVSKGAAFSGAR